MALDKTLEAIEELQPTGVTAIANHLKQHRTGVAREVRLLHLQGKIRRVFDGWEVDDKNTLPLVKDLTGNMVKYQENPLIKWLALARHYRPANLPALQEYMANTFPKEQIEEIITACQLVILITKDFEGVPSNVKGFNYEDRSILDTMPSEELIQIFKKKKKTSSKREENYIDMEEENKRYMPKEETPEERDRRIAYENRKEDLSIEAILREAEERKNKDV